MPIEFRLFLLTVLFHATQLLALMAASIVMWGENHVLFGSPLYHGWELIWFPGLPIIMIATVSSWFWYYIALPNIAQGNTQ